MISNNDYWEAGKEAEAEAIYDAAACFEAAAEAGDPESEGALEKGCEGLLKVGKALQKRTPPERGGGLPVSSS